MDQHESTYKPGSRTAKWWDERLPVMRLMHAQFVDFPTPRNLNYLWTFGGILTFCLAIQLVSGIVLAMLPLMVVVLSLAATLGLFRDLLAHGLGFSNFVNEATGNVHGWDSM